MLNIRVPDEQEKRIIRENGMDPERFGVSYRDDTSIRLLNYRTRDYITIHKGDRRWDA